jgi:hypothetical protein
MKQKTNWKIQVWADSLESGKSQNDSAKIEKTIFAWFYAIRFIQIMICGEIRFFRKVGISFWNGMTPMQKKKKELSKNMSPLPLPI